jgi:hypothetical protein
MKIFLALIAAAAIGLGTVSIWGSCKQNYSVCETWCSLANFNSDLGKAGCKAECLADQVSCETKAGADQIKRSLDGAGN